MESNNFDNYYKVYLDQCMALVATMVIKCNRQALDMNLGVMRLLGKLNCINQNDKTTWKYYRHISGEYHETDEPMYVVSIDTTEKIIFNKENLNIHKATKKEYSYGNDKYEELVERYPDKELLIKGILNPVDIHEAINAETGTILSYDKRFVEPNEDSLIYRLQNWIYGIYSRWYNPQYNIDNRYYNITFWLVLYPKILEEILNIRLELCLTNEAHSYHYRRRLASHGFLDSYLDNLTIKQALILYKNIPWIEIYVGQKFTFQYLTDKLMTLRNLPLAEFNMVQNYEKLSEEVLTKPDFEKVSLNGLEHIIPEIETLNLKRIMDKEDPLAPYNLKDRERQEKEAQFSMSSSRDSFLKTKVLQSKVIDYTGSEIYPMDNVLLDLWIDLASRDMYKAYINIRNPVTGEIVPLSAKDALILFTLCMFRFYNVDSDCIPPFYIGLMPRKTIPTYKELEAAIPDKTKVDSKYINFLITQYSKQRVNISTFDFYDQAKEIFNNINNLFNLVAKEDNLFTRGYKEVMTYKLFRSEVVNLRKPNMVTFEQFLNSISLDLKGIKKNDYIRLAKEIWLKMTGLNNVKIRSLYNIQEAMINLFKQLSSYSIQFIKEINEERINYVKNTDIRLDNGKASVSSSTNLPFWSTVNVESIEGSEINVANAYSTPFNDDKIRKDTGSDEFGNKEYLYSHCNYDINIQILNLSRHKSFKNKSYNDTYGTVSTFVQFKPDDLTGLSNKWGLPPVPGIRSFLQLPLEAKKLFAENYGYCINWNDFEENKEEPKEDIDWNITSSTLDGLDYTEPN